MFHPAKFYLNSIVSFKDLAHELLSKHCSSFSLWGWHEKKMKLEYHLHTQYSTVSFMAIIWKQVGVHVTLINTKRYMLQAHVPNLLCSCVWKLAGLASR